MQLLTVLGTGSYQKTRYTWQDKQIETPYVAEALCEFFQPTQVTVFVTAEAKNKHWENLQQQLGDRFLLTPISIPSGKSEAEVWQIFEAVVSSVEPSTKVLFDITHAFRSIPLLVLLAAAFLEKAKNVKIEGVYYGAFEANREQPPIFNLTPAIKLLDWLTATDKFLTTGSSVDLAQLLSTIQQDFYRSGKNKQAEIRPIRLKTIGDRIGAISRSLELIRPLDLMTEAAQFQALPATQLQEEVGLFAKPFELLLEQIQRDYGQFALANPRQARADAVMQKKFLLLRWYVAKGLGTQAILLAREWIISAFCFAEGVNYLDRSERTKIEMQLGQTIDPKSSLEPPIARYVTDIKQLSAIWSKLTEYRNDLAHTQMRSTTISALTLQNYTRVELLKSLSALFPDFVA
ncbi:TIGR02221 family CRISPR-associated protein [Pleurocapsales cyanobacterium LEGE 06147]|nr:TIGR02221 family CRISPR-associated protein [Pleurocapsales cyanobacterium LEGE 06147]